VFGDDFGVYISLKKLAKFNCEKYRSVTYLVVISPCSMKFGYFDFVSRTQVFSEEALEVTFRSPKHLLRLVSHFGKSPSVVKR
jgi:hypothetical protein